MFRKQALQTTLRARRRSLLFVALLALISALLATSLGMSAALHRALTLCRENYVTIGLAEYIGGGYPELRRVDTGAIEACAAMESSLEADEALLSYEPTRMALGYIEGSPAHGTSDEAVLIVRVRRSDTDNYDGSPFYYALVEEALFSARDIEGMLIHLDGDIPLLADHTYVVHGTYYLGFSSYPYFSPGDYTSPDGSVTIAACEDITAESGGYALGADSPYRLVAQTLDVRSRALTAWYSDTPDTLYPFHQSELTLAEGTWCSAGGCLLSQDTAKAMGITVGDTVTLSTAARDDTLLTDCYWAGNGFDTAREYRVDGLFTGSNDWSYTVFLPVSADIPTMLGSYTVGQLRFANGTAQDYLARIDGALPDGVRVTIYDQGYAAAESSLGTMLRSIGVIGAVCLAAGLAFLLLYAYLLIFREQRTALTMERIGVARRDILRYDGWCALFPALFGCALGFAVSVAACNTLERVVGDVLARESGADLHFSNSALSVSRSAADFLAAPSALLLLALCAAVVVAAVALAILFGMLALRRRRASHRFLPRRSGARSRALTGGSLQYALLSITRGGMRSCVPVLALLCAGVLFCRLAAVTAGTQAELAQLQQSSSVRGYATDYSGRAFNQLVISSDAVDTLAAIDGVTDVTVARAANYYIVYANHQDGTSEGPGFRERKESTFGAETFMNYLLSCDELIFTSSLHGAAEFLYAKSVEVEYLEGWDESLFTETELTTTVTVDEDGNIYHTTNGAVCVMPTSLMEQYHIQLGDTVLLEFAPDSTSYGAMDFLVVGSFVQEGAANHIYVPISLFDGYGSTQMNYQTVTFTVPDCSKLEGVKNALYASNFSEANRLRATRVFLTINDASYLSSLHAGEQRLWYMERLFPLIDALAVALAFFLGRLLLGRRAGEIRTLRSMGVSQGTVFRDLFLEQLLLALPGAGLSAGVCLALREWSAIGALWLAAFTVSYLLGALAALTRANGRAILKNRREQEA